MFVLEPGTQARRRSARAYAELAGCGARSDAYNMVIPSPDPGPAILAVRQALDDAGVNPAEVDYVNAHATSTPVGDVAEARVLATVFGDDVARVPVSSTKSMTGHLLGAAGGVEAAFSALALYHGIIPPTINVDNQDPQCDLDVVPNQAREVRIKTAVSNSFGFGGTNAVVALQRFE